MIEGESISSREYFALQISTLQKEIESTRVALEKSTEVARVSMEKRLDSMNEFRDQLKDQAANFISRNEYNKLAEEIRDIREYREALSIKISGLQKDVDNSRFSSEKSVDDARVAIEKRLDTMNEFRQSLEDQTTTYMTTNTYNAKHEVLQSQVDELRLARAEMQGKASMTSVYVGWLIAGISIIISVVSLFIHAGTIVK